MDIQLIIVIIIGIVTGTIVARSIYRFFFTKRDSSYCGGCKGCDFSKQSAQYFDINSLSK